MPKYAIHYKITKMVPVTTDHDIVIESSSKKDACLDLIELISKGDECFIGEVTECEEIKVQ
jgi:hypothetical protein